MNVVYISPNGVGTPLVRSQVLPYLGGLREHGVVADLITFEREGDPAFPAAELERRRWHPITVDGPGTLRRRSFDLVRATVLGLYLVVRRRASLVHARSYLPASVALIVAMLTRVPYIFDMRGFLGDEYAEGRHWRASDARLRAVMLAERVLLRCAAGVVVLSERAAARLRTDPRFGGVVRTKPVVVVPAAVDLDRFAPGGPRSDVPTLVYSGSLGMSYALDAMLRVYVEARRLVRDLRLLVLNVGQHELARETISRLGLADADIVVRAASFDAMPGLLASAHVGICLLEQVTSKEASSPTKIGEYLACGLPVIVNRGQGDVADRIDQYRAGYVVAAYSPADLRRAGEALVGLLGDDSVRGRARGLAEAHFGLAATVDAYWSLYRSVLAGTPSGQMGRERVGDADETAR